MNAFNPTNSCVRDNNHDSGKIFCLFYVHDMQREYADSGFSQSAEFHIRLWTGEPNGDLLPSPICFCARRLNLGSGGREGASLNQLFLSLVFFFFFLLPSSLSPFLTMNLLVLRDPSRSKQAVTSACSLWRKGSQNLNIYGMQCETKIPVLLVLVFWGLFIAAACVFLGCCPAKRSSRKKKPFACVEILSSSCFLSHTCS